MKKILTGLTLLISSLSAEIPGGFLMMEKPATTLLGIECRTSNDADAGPQDIPKHWNRFFSENILSQIPNKASEEVIALYCDYEGDHTAPYTFFIGCSVSSVDEIPEGLVVKNLPASTYAVFRAVGEFPSNVAQTWGKIWNTPLKRTYTGDFEVYTSLENPEEVEIYIAIENDDTQD